MVIFHMLVTSWGTQVEEFENQHEETLEMMSWGNSCGLWIEIYIVSWGIGGLVTVARSAWWACLTIDNRHVRVENPIVLAPANFELAQFFPETVIYNIDNTVDNTVQIIYIYLFTYFYLYTYTHFYTHIPSGYLLHSHGIDGPWK
jgi:hypothetical protein